MNNKTLCIYHGKCLDGFGAAYAVWKAGRDEVEFHEGFYNKQPPDVTGREVLLVDFSYKREVLEQMAASAASVTILDHHETARDDLQPLLDNGVVFGEFDMSRSGAVIAWEYFHETPVPEMLLHIQDRDLWQFKLPNTREICDALYSYPFDFERWAFFEENFHRLIEEGLTIRRQLDKQVASLRPNVQRAIIGGYDVPVVNAPPFLASDLAGALAEGEFFAGVYWIDKDGVNFSLRARKDSAVHVGRLAEKEYGGGGHAAAAGFSLPSYDDIHWAYV